MRVRNVVLIVAIGLYLSATAPAADFDKYIPADSQFFVHVRVPKLFASDMVRKVVPVAIDKYSDQIINMAGMAKTFNPNAPDIPEDQMKEGLKQASDPKNVAKAFDAAQNIVTDVVVAGSTHDDKPNFVILVKCAFITTENAEMVAGFAGLNPQIKLDRIKKSKGTIYAVTAPQQDKQVFLTVPEKGVLHMCFSEKDAEASFSPSGKVGVKLGELVSKKTDKDFVFVAGLGKDDGDYSAMTMNLILDKDLSANVNMTYKDEKKAADQAKEMNQKFAELGEQMAGFLGDKAEAIKKQLSAGKATANGKNVTATIVIPGAAVEKLVSKD